MSELGLIDGYLEDDASSSTPQLSFPRMFRLALRTWPYMRPMLKHLIVLGAFALSGALVAVVAGFIGTDLFYNKVLIGQKLQPVQATVLFVGGEYVTADLTGTSNKQIKKDRKGAARKSKVAPTRRLLIGKGSKGAKAQLDIEPELTVEQRKTVRDRLIVWAVVGGLLGGLVFAVAAYYGMWVWQSINQNLRVAMLSRAESLSLKYHDNARVGDAIFRVFQDSAMILNLLQSGIIIPITIVYAIAVGLLFLVAFDPWFALLVIIVAVPMVWVTVTFTTRIRRRAMNNRIANSDLTSRLQEIFSAIKVVKANRAETWVFDRFNEDSRRALNTAYFLRLDMVIVGVVVALMGGATLVLTEYIMITWVIDERETFLGAMVAAFIGFVVWNLGAFRAARDRIDGLGGSERYLVGVWYRMQDLFIALERAFYLLDLEPEVVDPDEPVSFPSPLQSVRWRSVFFDHDETHAVLQGIDLHAEAGTVTAVVGATGSGKSTMMSLLLRLYDPDRGQVLVNDVNLRDLAVDDIRANTSIALQKNVLFADTVAKNIGYASTDAKRSDIEAAAGIACADEFIQAMAKGYDTELGERGGKLSAGERQRLSIARALVRDTPILILDEPTASLDARMEHQVLANLADWGKGKVIFLITHRLSTIRNADQIAFLEDGQIVEQGTHDELIVKEGGRYREFVTAELADGGLAEERDNQ